MEGDHLDEGEHPNDDDISEYNKKKDEVIEKVQRGRTVMTQVIKLRAKNIKIKVEWNKNCQPIKKGGKQLVGYLGVIVRKEVPITIKDWRYVKKDGIKKAVWKELLVSYFL